MTRKKVILYLLLLMVGFSAGYSLKPSIITAPVEYLYLPTEKVEESKTLECYTQSCVEYNNLPYAKIEETKIPECFMGSCPKYFSMIVDKDWGLSASVIVVRTAMTQGAGQVIIVKK